jgi:hypothetical protein
MLGNALPLNCILALFLFLYCDRVLLSSPGWLQTWDPPAFDSQELELQVCTTTPSPGGLLLKHVRDSSTMTEARHLEFSEEKECNPC